MIYRLEIENFFSIRDLQIIDLQIDNTTLDEPGRLEPIWTRSSERAPKVVALFGANASGKSNVLKALSFLAWFLRNSFQQAPGAHLPFLSFLDEESSKRSTRLSVHLSGPAALDRLDNKVLQLCPYQYELIMSGLPRRLVVSETLKYCPPSAGRPVFLFKRDKTNEIKAHKLFSMSGYASPLKNVLRDNVSVIATLAHLNHPISTYFWEAAGSVRSNIARERAELSDDHTAQIYWTNPEILEALNKEIERIDLGIRAVRLQPKPHNGLPHAVFQHYGLNEEIYFQHESHGTRQFVKIFPFIYQALKVGGIAIIDELDISIHPLILPEILRWFYDAKRNPKNAQLWMTCQSASLLQELIKEEVIFCEKDQNGRTAIYGLRDIQAVRRTDNFFQKYLSGVYGAVPQIG